MVDLHLNRGNENKALKHRAVVASFDNHARSSSAANGHTKQSMRRWRMAWHSNQRQRAIAGPSYSLVQYNSRGKVPTHGTPVGAQGRLSMKHMQGVGMKIACAAGE